MYTCIWPCEKIRWKLHGIYTISDMIFPQLFFKIWREERLNVEYTIWFQINWLQKTKNHNILTDDLIKTCAINDNFRQLLVISSSF